MDLSLPIDVVYGYVKPAIFQCREFTVPRAPPSPSSLGEEWWGDDVFDIEKLNAQLEGEGGMVRMAFHEAHIAAHTVKAKRIVLFFIEDPTPHLAILGSRCYSVRVVQVAMRGASIIPAPYVWVVVAEKSIQPNKVWDVEIVPLVVDLSPSPLPSSPSLLLPAKVLWDLPPVVVKKLLKIAFKDKDEWNVIYRSSVTPKGPRINYNLIGHETLFSEIALPSSASSFPDAARKLGW
jgi:hypothetical protein